MADGLLLILTRMIGECAQLCNRTKLIEFVKWNDGSVEFSDRVKDNGIPSVDSGFRL